MKLAVIGTGYVGLVTGACFANLGNEVTCVDKDKQRLGVLEKGEVPFYEPGLPEIAAKNHKAKRLLFTSDLNSAVKKAEVIFIAVGTPPKENGQADISAVIEVAKGIAKALKGNKKFKVIVNKSTVPVGMGDIVTKILKEMKIPESSFSVVSNPEFLREGSAISDFLNPDRIVIGASNNRAFNIITELYRSLNAHIIFTSVKSAELIKYASNAFLATKISFINEIANICERVGSDVKEVAYAMGMDKRIGREFLNAGLGYGGSCLPKDVSALIHVAREAGYDPQVLTSVNEINNYQIDSFIGKISKTLKNLRGKNIAVLGLAFKPETDDLREAPALKVINDLIRQGARIKAYDPAAEKSARKLIPQVTFSPGVYDAIEGADAIVLVTEWPEFMDLDLEKARKLVKKAYLFDGRNIYDPKRVREAGFKYIGVGR
ncbi:MAG: UDP-glucose/GDP-mannose dehydrogenase family protein [Candidatus Margulisiibacteriota bacterium]